MIHLDDLLKATGGEVRGEVGATVFDDFGFDSRALRPGQLFIAVRTTTGDGHDYIAEACAAGAAGVLCEEPCGLDGCDVTCVVVEDTRSALIEWARYILGKYGPKVVGVTGSSGKTTAKEAIAQVLSTRHNVFKNFGSYNGLYGLPIALGRLEQGHEIAVLEMACDSFGEIERLANLTHPAVGVVTSINETHLAYLGSLGAIALEKGHLIEALPFDGAAILNADDPRVASMVPLTRARIITFGLGESARVRAADISQDRDGLSFTLRHGKDSYPARFPLVGRHNVYAALAAVAVGLAFDVPVRAALDALAEMPRLPGRLRPIEGRKGTLILDDTFNSSPAAAIAALDTLAEMRGANKVAVLGDMSDLGEYRREGHERVGRRAAEVVTRLVTKGEKGRIIAQAAQQAGLVAQAVNVTFTTDDAVGALDDILGPDTVVLVKGSSGVRLERVVARLMQKPEDAPRVLVRQSPGWERVRPAPPTRPTWVEIDLSAVANNVRLLSEICAPAEVMAVLKADAYGHGALKVAHTVLNNGARWLGVAMLGEAVDMRRSGIDAPILVLGYTPPWQAREVVLNNVTATIYDADVARALSQAAADVKGTARVHVKVDTGMGRLGLLPDEVPPLLREISGMPGLVVEGIFTHFSMADEADLSYTRSQLDKFNALLEELGGEGLRPPLAHAANSAGALRIPGSRFEIIRAGISIYGLPPSKDAPLPEGFRPALTFKTTVAQVKRLCPGSRISYGGIYCTRGWETIAVLPVGYADGFRRSPANWGEVLVKGRRAPIVGNICMDQAMIDVTHIPNVRQGDEVVLIGQQGEERITVEEVAERFGTINYEVVSEILARVPRVS